jgi:hypothetical protein
MVTQTAANRNPMPLAAVENVLSAALYLYR